mmetsp:Transcript_35180/g.98809  ORF Transcript_35180/g.98809 Transcript_35180/m.98809 type:complete len:255 (+) Transcript_35180:158-922(+)
MSSAGSLTQRRSFRTSTTCRSTQWPRCATGLCAAGFTGDCIPAALPRHRGGRGAGPATAAPCSATRRCTCGGLCARGLPGNRKVCATCGGAAEPAGSWGVDASRDENPAEWWCGWPDGRAGFDTNCGDWAPVGRLGLLYCGGRCSPGAALQPRGRVALRPAGGSCLHCAGGLDCSICTPRTPGGAGVPGLFWNPGAGGVIADAGGCGLPAWSRRMPPMRWSTSWTLWLCCWVSPRTAKVTFAMAAPEEFHAVTW